METANGCGAMLLAVIAIGGFIGTLVSIFTGIPFLTAVMWSMGGTLVVLGLITVANSGGQN